MMVVQTYPIYEQWKDKVVDLESLENWRETLEMRSEGGLTVCYAPFDYINRNASVVLVGITPGETQALNALQAVRTSVNLGLRTDELLREAKSVASFSGKMRDNLIAMLDHIGLARILNIDTCAALFVPGNELAHFTSVLRYPVFLKGENYSGTPKPLSNTILVEQIELFFRKEVQLLHDAWFIPLGATPEAVLTHYIARGVLDEEQVLSGIPHPSGANVERIQYFLGLKPANALSAKTHATKIDCAKNRLHKKLSQRVDTIKNTKKMAINPPEFNSISVLVTEKYPDGVAHKIYARGKDDVFVPYKDKAGNYSMYSRHKMQQTGEPIHHASNKESITDIKDVVQRLRDGTHHIRLRGKETGKCNVFAPKSVTITE